jgi:hypothetical protein
MSKETTTAAQDLKVGDVTEFGTVAQFGIQSSGRSMRLVQFTDGTWKKFRATTKLTIIK